MRKNSAAALTFGFICLMPGLATTYSFKDTMTKAVRRRKERSLM